MSLLKAQIRVAVTNDIGSDLDDQLEQARREVQQQEGAKVAYATAQKHVEQLLVHMQREIEDGKLDLESGALVSKWVQKAAGVCDSLGVQAQQLWLVRTGAVSQNERLLGLLKKRMDTEKARLQELLQVAQSDKVQSIPVADPTVGSAPPSLKQLRQAEAAEVAKATVVPVKAKPTKRGRRVANAG